MTTIKEAVERTLAIKAAELGHELGSFSTQLVPGRKGSMAFCQKCWYAAWTITSAKPIAAGGLATTGKCLG